MGILLVCTGQEVHHSVKLSLNECEASIALTNMTVATKIRYVRENV